MKDPAFLFYPGDWMGGTLLLNRAQKGCYIDLLVAQFNNGPLTLEEIKTLLGSDFGHWPKIEKKFTFMNGRYYNQRLEAEKSKRSNFTESRRSNRSKKDMSNHMSPHMEDINENRNVLSINSYGELGNVTLTSEEFEKLKTSLGEKNTLILIGELDLYIAQKGKNPYKSHYAAILTWARRRVNDHVEKSTTKKIGSV